MLEMSARSRKKILNKVKSLTPEAFNGLEYDDKFACFQAIFNEYVERVAIPKNWSFTKTITRWPSGSTKGEKIDEMTARIIVSDEKHKLLQEILSYPDLGAFALQNYNLMVDNDIETYGPEKPVLRLYKVSKAEAWSFVRGLMKEVQTIKDSKPISERWDEREKREALAFDMVDRLDRLSSMERSSLVAYILLEYARQKGIPVPEYDINFEIDMKKVVRENTRLIKLISSKTYKNDFWWYGFGNYGINIHVTKQKYSIEKIPDEIIKMILKMLKANDGDLTDEQVRELKDRWEEFRRVKKHRDS